MHGSSLLIVFLASMLGGFYGTSAGGGGLVIMGSLILMGISPKEAVPVVMAGGLGMCMVNWFVFHRAKNIDYPLAWRLAVIVIIGSVIGTRILISISDSMMNRIIAIAFVFILLSVIFNKQIGTISKHTSSRRKIVGTAVFGLLGIYLSLINAGTAIFGNYVLATFFGKTFLESSGDRTIIFTPGLLIGFILYAVAGTLDWQLVAMTFVGAGLG